MYAERHFRLPNRDFVCLRVEATCQWAHDELRWRVKAEVRKPRSREWRKVEDWRKVATIEQVRALQWEIIQAIKLREPWEL